MYGFFSGIGTGITYMIPLVCAYKYFPNKKGLITGIIVGSYGLGSSIFNIVATKIVNPENAKPYLKAPNGDKNLKFFDEMVADRVPMMFRILCAVWLCLILGSAALISLPSSSSEAESNYNQMENEGQNKINSASTSDIGSESGRTTP